MIAPQTRYASRPEGKVAYQVLGNGPPDVVFLHDWITNVEIMWEDAGLSRFLRRIASFSRLIYFDQLGYGASDRAPVFNQPLEIYLDDVRAVMDATGSQRVTLFAHAEGSAVALLFAATFPDKVSSLIIVDGAARRIRAPDYEWGIPAEIFEKYAEAFDRGFGREPSLTKSPPAAPAIRRFAIGTDVFRVCRWALPMRLSDGAA